MQIESKMSKLLIGLFIIYHSINLFYNSYDKINKEQLCQKISSFFFLFSGISCIMDNYHLCLSLAISGLIVQLMVYI